MAVQRVLGLRVEDGNEGADLPEWDAADGEEALPFADDGVHHGVEDGGGDGAALGDATSRLERKLVVARDFTNQDTVVPKSFYQPLRLGSHPAVL